MELEKLKTKGLFQIGLLPCDDREAEEEVDSDVDSDGHECEYLRGQLRLSILL